MLDGSSAGSLLVTARVAGDPADRRRDAVLRRRRPRRLHAALATQVAASDSADLERAACTCTAVRSWRRQTVYVSNHSSTLDLFVLVALGLPNTRFFLSGFLQKIVPLGIIAR